MTKQVRHITKPGMIATVIAEKETLYVISPDSEACQKFVGSDGVIDASKSCWEPVPA